MKRPEESLLSGQAAPAVACPFCGSSDVELLALFGSQLLTDQYYCRACRTPFEHLRADAPDSVAPKDTSEHDDRDVSGPAGRVSRED
ncbi:MAG TPA: hypothetical protein VFU63_14145 [Ktedonobacterales bacterium]|nr:hypothetical protein [Ktedonobacterales bacterium]